MGGDPRRLLPRRVGARLAPPAVPRRERPDRASRSMAEYVYGGKNVLFWITQLATFAILILAANTAYRASPALSSIIARDGYLPRQLANRGDKLVFSNGIIFLAVAAGDPDHRLQGQHLGPDPAVRVRRVHRVHAEPGRDGRAPLPRCASRGGGRRWRSTPSAACATGDRRARRRRLQVHRGRVDPGGADPRAGRGRSAPIAQPLPPACATAVRDRAGVQARGARTHLVDRARRHRPQGRARRRPVRPSAGPRPADRRLRRDRRRGAGAAGRGVGRTTTCRSRCTRSRRRTAS